MALSQWHTTAAANSSVGAINWAEGQSPATVNDSSRAEMADVRSFYENIEWRDWGHTPTYSAASAFTISDAASLSLIYPVNRRVKVIDGGGTVYGTILTTTWVASTQTVTLSMDSGTLTNPMTSVSVGPDITNQPVHASGVKYAARTDTANTFTAISTFNKEIILGASAEVATANSFQLVGANTLYHLAAGGIFLWKRAATGAAADLFKLYDNGGIVGCDASGTEATGGDKGRGTGNFQSVWDGGNRVYSALQAPVSKSDNTVYQATADGVLQGSYSLNSSTGTFAIYTDAANPPTTKVTGAGAFSTATEVPFSVQVKKNNYYKAVGTNFSSAIINFVPYTA